MRKIIFKEELPTINFRSVNISDPIFAKKAGKLAGMIVRDDKGWALMLGGKTHWNGFYNDLESCIKSAKETGDFSFYT